MGDLSHYGIRRSQHTALARGVLCPPQRGEAQLRSVMTTAAQKARALCALENDGRVLIGWVDGGVQVQHGRAVT